MKKKIFLKNIEKSHFCIASEGALCLEYRFYAIFCFKGATLNEENSFQRHLEKSQDN